MAAFLSVFAGPEAPLALFLDDLQWADPATLRVLGALLRLPEPTHLLVLGASRDNQLGEGHALVHPPAQALAELQGGPADVRRVKLHGLRPEEVRALVADTVHRSAAEVEPLAALVAEKTSGNPFFVGVFLRTLHDGGLLRFCAERRAWVWDLEDIEALGVTANVADLLAHRIDRLPPETQRVLRVAACLGGTFDLALLAAVAGASPRHALEDLGPAERERMVVPLDAQTGPAGGRYQFAHDRVQQAAYEGLPAGAQRATHLRIGRIVRDAATPETRGERISTSSTR